LKTDLVLKNSLEPSYAYKRHTSIDLPDRISPYLVIDMRVGTNKFFVSCNLIFVNVN